MTVPRRIELTYRVRFDECGPDGMLRSSGYLRYAQETAWVHSERAGFDRRWYRERSLTWLVRCVDLEIARDVEHGQQLRVSTEVVGWRRVWARRRSEFRAANGTLCASADIDWVLLGPGGTPVRVPSEISAFFTDFGVGSFEPARVVLPATPDDARPRAIVVRPRDLDPMGHVNNAVYLDYLEDLLADIGGAAHAPTTTARRLGLEYVRPARPRQRLAGAAWREGDGWAARLVGEDGDELLRARLRWSG